jgi:glutathione S-transferase
MLTLYQFPISHYCEKARWALDYKGLDHKIINLLPGQHIKIIKAIAPDSEVPVLQQDQEIIQGSGNIISWLDQRYPATPLTPIDAQSKQQALEWEHYANENIGPHIRLYFYHYLLEQPELTVPMLAQGQPFHKRFLFRVIYPKVRSIMRQHMNINERTARISLKILERAINKLHAHYAHHGFLVGDQFSRADLAAASLLAPLVEPAKYGISWPTHYPGELQQTIYDFRDRLDWVDRLYRLYR